MGSPGISRRRLLGLGAAGAASLAACAGGTTSGPGAPVSMRTGSFTSRFRPQTATGWSVAVPETARSTPDGATPGRPPVAVFLHGTGADHRMVFEELRAADVLSQHVARGGTPFAIASVDGGESWWHRRATGTDTQAMVVEEFIPLLAGQGLDTGRLAVFGPSMGGFGALRSGASTTPDGRTTLTAPGISRPTTSLPSGPSLSCCRRESTAACQTTCSTA